MRQATAQTWHVHHPSMIEALQQELAEKSSQLLLYLQGANLSAILRDTTTLPPPPDTRLVFLSDAVYDILSKRLDEADEKDLPKVGEYLAERASDVLLLKIYKERPTLLDDILELSPEPEGAEVAARIAARLKATPVVEKKSLPAVLATNREEGPASRIADPPTRFAGDGEAKQSEVGGVVTLLEAIVGALFAALRPRASLVIENLALRRQLSILRRSRPRPRLRPLDRAFWVVLCRTWSRWADALAIVNPATVNAWHRRGFARVWASKSKPIGRPPLAEEIIALIVRMAGENPTWCRRRVASELALLGHSVDKSTVAKYMPKPPARPRRPSQTWATFVRNHLVGTIAIDFLTVPTATFGVLARGRCADHARH